MSVETITLGCRLNFAESETIARLAQPGEDWIVVNSCAVTNEAVRQTRQAIRKAREAALADPEGQALGSFTHWIFAALITTFFPKVVTAFAPG